MRYGYDNDVCYFHFRNMCVYHTYAAHSGANKGDGKMRCGYIMTYDVY